MCLFETSCRVGAFRSRDSGFWISRILLRYFGSFARVFPIVRVSYLFLWRKLHPYLFDTSVALAGCKVPGVPMHPASQEQSENTEFGVYPYFPRHQRGTVSCPATHMWQWTLFYFPFPISHVFPSSRFPSVVCSGLRLPEYSWRSWMIRLPDLYSICRP